MARPKGFQKVSEVSDHARLDHKVGREWVCFRCFNSARREA
jgi:hypothetical protein